MPAPRRPTPISNEDNDDHYKITKNSKDGSGRLLTSNEDNENIISGHLVMETGRPTLISNKSNDDCS